MPNFACSVDVKFLYNYVKEYCEVVENLPNEIQPFLSTIRSLDIECDEIVGELERCQVLLANHKMSTRKRGAMLEHVEQLFYRGQSNGDRKIEALNALIGKVHKANAPLDRFAAILEPVEAPPPAPNRGPGGRRPAISQPMSSSSQLDRRSSPPPPSNSVLSITAGRLKRKPKPGIGEASIEESKLQRRCSGRTTTTSTPRVAVASRRGGRHHASNSTHVPDEPTYCLCQQVSFGEMIGCDNEKCAIEWFHFECVHLKSKPKGKWFCPNCRGDRINIPLKSAK